MTIHCLTLMKMNKRTSIFLLLLSISIFTINSNAQSVEALFKKYQDNKSFRYVSISKRMINLASFFGKGDAGNKEMLSSVDEMKILTLKSKRKSKKARAFFFDIEKTLTPVPPFENLMEARENGAHTKVLDRKDKNNKTEILIISKSDTIQHFIWLYGNISTTELQNMIKR